MITDRNDPEGIAPDNVDHMDDETADIASLLGDPDDLGDADEDDESNEAEASDETDDAAPDTEEDEASDDEDGDEEADETDDESEPDLSDVELFLTDGRKVNRKQIEAAFTAERDMKAAFTRKTQEIAESRKALESEAQTVAQQKQQYEQVVPFAMSVLQNMIPPAATDEEHQNDPIGAMAKDRAHSRAMSQLQALHAEHQKHQQVTQQQSGQEWQQSKAQLRDALFARRPDLQDKAKFSEYEEQVAKDLELLGLDRSDLASIVDDRHLQIIEKAAAYDRLKAQKPKLAKKAENAPPVQKPGVRKGQNAGKSGRRAELEKKLRQTGDARYADALFVDLVD